jgi:hypothetical protein
VHLKAYGGVRRGLPDTSARGGTGSRRRRTRSTDGSWSARKARGATGTTDSLTAFAIRGHTRTLARTCTCTCTYACARTQPYARTDPDRSTLHVDPNGTSAWNSLLSGTQLTDSMNARDSAAAPPPSKHSRAKGAKSTALQLCCILLHCVSLCCILSHLLQSAALCCIYMFCCIGAAFGCTRLPFVASALHSVALGCLSLIRRCRPEALDILCANRSVRCPVLAGRAAAHQGAASTLRDTVL